MAAPPQSSITLTSDQLLEILSTPKDKELILKNFPFPGRETLFLPMMDPISPDCSIQINRKETKSCKEFLPSSNRTVWHGVLLGNQKGDVYLSTFQIDPKMLRVFGSVMIGDEYYGLPGLGTFLQFPLSKVSKEAVEFQKADKKMIEELMKDFFKEEGEIVDENDKKTQAKERFPGVLERREPLHRLHVAIESDYEFYEELRQWCLRDYSAPQFCRQPNTLMPIICAFIGDMFASANVVFNRDLKIAMQIDFFSLWNQNTDPWPDDMWMGRRRNVTRRLWADWIREGTRREYPLAVFLSGVRAAGNSYANVVCDGVYDGVYHALGSVVGFNLPDRVDPFFQNEAMRQIVAPFFAVDTLVHELGHALGTHHPFHRREYNPPIDCCAVEGSENDPNVDDAEERAQCRLEVYGDRNFDENTIDHDIMSYCNAELYFHPREIQKIWERNDEKFDNPQCYETIVNRPPQIRNIRFSEEPIPLNEDVEICVDAVDPEGDRPIFYVWSIEEEPPRLETSTWPCITYTRRANVRIEGRVHVFDRWGNGIGRFFHIDPLPDLLPPEVSSIKCFTRASDTNNGRLFSMVGNEVNLAALVTDPDSSHIRTHWSFGDETPSVENILHCASSPCRLWELEDNVFHTYAESGTYRVSFSAEDPGNRSDNAELEMVVLPRPTLMDLVLPPQIDEGPFVASATIDTHLPADQLHRRLEVHTIIGDLQQGGRIVIRQEYTAGDLARGIRIEMPSNDYRMQRLRRQRGNVRVDMAVFYVSSPEERTCRAGITMCEGHITIQ